MEVAGVTVNRLCASGLAAVNQAARAIRAGEGEVFIAGGVESMSRAPYSVPKADQLLSLLATSPPGIRPLGWRYPNPHMIETYGIESMGETAENIAEATGITRAEQDAFALESHRRAVAAIDDGRFAAEIVPVPVPQRKGDPLLVDRPMSARAGILRWNRWVA